MKLTLKTVLWACLVIAATACSKTPSFVTARDGQFFKNGHPYTYIGTNFWYGPILASDGQGSDFTRLARELDTLKALGQCLRPGRHHGRRHRPNGQVFGRARHAGAGTGAAARVRGIRFPARRLFSVHERLIRRCSASRFLNSRWHKSRKAVLLFREKTLSLQK